MRCDLPVLLRCCFCFPLRYGLLAWAYIKEIINLMLVLFLTLRLCESNSALTVWGYVVTSSVIVFIILDIAFLVFFIISAHIKDYKKIRIFYRYSIAQLCMNVVLPILLLAWWIYIIYMAPLVLIVLFSVILPSLLICVLLIIIQGYLVILVRSEFVKLKNNSQFEFVNHAAEQRCAANIDFEKQNPASL